LIQRSFTTQSLYTVNFQIYFKLSAFSSSYPQVWWTFWSSGIALLPIWDVCVRIQRNPMNGKTLAMLVERSLFKCMAIRWPRQDIDYGNWGWLICPLYSTCGYTDPSKCFNDQTLRSDTEFCRTSLFKCPTKLSDKMSDKILPGRSESFHSQIVKL
jgi:hypothetical protein